MSEIIGCEKLGAVHFIGIGGAGMSGIARVMIMRGLAVSGSDAKDSSVVTALRALGARITIGHDPRTIEGADTVVVSSAIRETNSELVAARAAGLRILHRSQALASLMVNRRTVAIAGTHGKTTTTSMTTVALQSAGLDPSFVIGGVLTATGTNAHNGSGDVFVAEADESDGSFLLYEPAIGVVTNAEPDHLDHYGNWEAVEQAFITFCSHVGEQGGTVVSCADDAGAQGIAAAAEAAGVRVVRYGTASEADVRITEFVHSTGGANFTVQYEGSTYGPISLQQPGDYNVRNATAALTVALLLDAPADRAIAGLEAFGGTRRRFDLRGVAKGVRVFDDYAHHPTELTAVLTAAQAVVEPGKKVHVIFQPHLFSRTQNFKHEFGQALGIADDVAVLDVYPAREDPIPGVTGQLVADEVPLDSDHVAFLPAFSEAVGYMRPRLSPGDIVITAGAGDVTILGPELIDVLNR